MNQQIVKEVAHTINLLVCENLPCRSFCTYETNFISYANITFLCFRCKYFGYQFYASPPTKLLSSLPETLLAALLLPFFTLSLLVTGLSWEGLTDLLINFFDGSTELSSELLLDEVVPLGVSNLSLGCSVLSSTKPSFVRLAASSNEPLPVVSSLSLPVGCLTFAFESVSGSSAR